MIIQFNDGETKLPLKWNCIKPAVLALWSKQLFVRWSPQVCVWQSANLGHWWLQAFGYKFLDASLIKLIFGHICFPYLNPRTNKAASYHTVKELENLWHIICHQIKIQFLSMCHRQSLYFHRNTKCRLDKPSGECYWNRHQRIFGDLELTRLVLIV